MNPQILALSFVIGSVILMRAIRALGDCLYPPPSSRPVSKPTRAARDEVHNVTQSIGPGISAYS